MLVLTRRRGEGVTIGPDVRIVVHRDEVHARIQDENRIAAGPGVIPLEAFRQLSNKTGRRGG